MFDHAESGDQPVVRDGQRPSSIVPAVPGPSRPAETADPMPSGTATARPAGQPAPAATGTGPNASPERLTDTAASQHGSRGNHTAPGDVRCVAHLIPAAREARGRLAEGGRSLSRDALAAAMREQGDGVSNAHASQLLKVLKAEADATPFAVRPTASVGPR